MKRRYIFTEHFANGDVLLYSKVCDEQEVLDYIRGVAFALASSGICGDYPCDDGFSAEVEDGFSDDGRSWTAKDRTHVDVKEASSDGPVLVVSVSEKTFDWKDDIIGILTKVSRAKEVTFEFVGDDGWACGSDCSALITNREEQLYLISKLAEIATKKICNLP